MLNNSVCRITGNSDLVTVVDLGQHHLCGHFPSSKSDFIPLGDLKLGLSQSSSLLQLVDNPPVEEMYGDNYGYRSGLNMSMVNHLTTKASRLLEICNSDVIDVVLDIGSNDGTLLNTYPDTIAFKVGIDPTISKFINYYDPSVITHSGFFNSEVFLGITGSKKAKIITSISMFYDLPDPRGFCQQVRDVLHRDGIWHFEQSYMPSMLRTNSYDTICHEHIEYYSLQVVHNILLTVGLKIIDVTFNSINGGSFAVTAAHVDSKYSSNSTIINWMLRMEARMQLDSPGIYRKFEQTAYNHRRDLKDLMKSLRKEGMKVAGYGASTKGNVILQFCSLCESDIFAIAEVNEDKYGRYTPGTLIPIQSEEVVKAEAPDYLLVLPWHFRESILKRESDFLNQGGKLIFPLPEIEIVG
jgi:hypothetical protein